jgi:8-oxo-dGTP pyrophosphatase MutT (NUDIX family)
VRTRTNCATLVSVMTPRWLMQTWGLPGGNVDDDDEDLLATAKREAVEEMGSAPECEVKGQILTK